MLNFTHDIPTKLYFGRGQIKELANALKPFGKNVLMVYGGGSIKKIGLYDEIIKILNDNDFKYTECAGVEPNPRITSVELGVKLCKENNIDVVLAVGGGSNIDCAKAIAVGRYYEGNDLWEMVKEGSGLRKALPLVDILTLSATGSEFDGGGVITNMETNEKLGATFTYPAVSICDPTYTFTVSPYQTAAGSADIMSHIIEGYFSRTMDSDLSDGIAETVIKSVMKNCKIALKEPDNYNSRANLMADSSIACSGIPQYGKEGTGWPCHAMEHELSAYYDITHGVGLAILTIRWMRHILNKDASTIERFVKFARNVMGISYGEEVKGPGEVLPFDDEILKPVYDDRKISIAAIDALEKYFKDTGIPMTLTELGIDDKHFEEMAAHANEGGYLKDAYVPLTNEDIVEIYKACL